MQRLKDEFLSKIQNYLSFSAQAVLEVGCGIGTRSPQIAALCNTLTAVEPDATAVTTAQEQNSRPNIRYLCSAAQNMLFEDHSFDIVIFTLSLHHVPLLEIHKAIDEAIRVVRHNGYIVFFEPASKGSFFDSEILFDACDGDERKEKAYAYFSILQHPALQEIVELYDETIFRFDSVQDFIEHMKPKKNTENLDKFLRKNNFLLNAERRINICKPKL